MLFVVAGCGGDRDDKLPAILNHGADVEYVGIDRCRQCHVEIASTYRHTGMGRAWYPMTPAVAVEDWSENNEIEIAATGLRYRMLEREGRYFLRQFRADPRGREFAVDERELLWAVGSNNHSRSYVTLLDGKLFEAPVCWFPDARVWDLCPGFEHENNHFTRGLTLSCVFCHNGRMVPLQDEHYAFEQPIPHGIGCERCHGPGSLHVAKWESGEVPTGEPDPTIVNPRRLPLRQRFQICLQCHLGDSKSTERVGRVDRSVLDFRPGKDLTEVAVPFRYGDQVREFGLTAQADRLMLSECWKRSGGKIECLTCHNPHVTVYREDRPADYFRRRCLGCHAVEDCSEDSAVREATRRGEGSLFRGGHPGGIRSVVVHAGSPGRAPGVPLAAGAIADDCVVCHMRVAEPDDQRHTTFTDHWIRRRPEASPADHRESLRLEPILPEQHAGISDGERAFYRGRANLLLSVKTPDPRRRGMWEEAERSFRAAIEQGFDHGQSWFFLGRSLEYLKRIDEAERAFRTAYERDPGYYDAGLAVGQALGQLGRPAEAAAWFEELLERFPAAPGALAELGRFRMIGGRLEEGVELYGRAIAGEPWNAKLRLNRGMGLAQLGRFAEAAADAEDAARWNPDDPEVWEFYARVMAAAGRRDDAEAARQVLARLRGTTARSGAERDSRSPR